ncbi:MAG: hypothetical protein COT92_00715 [Candidatus Doudnabacteria bacterium CG10_big_fil_rev_8_21_14_0_10_42_18]|uniref:Uncharacterized protein n=1 Tax=Candidatus Doudnabacteria bacterium CG10_big_fil_rev_8_21_14_0_10_42_18 TaxID=1974552 RepID=A0A2H0VBP4_9BACT|nr:MAG: hypothetical protein COT92_00715 [Candidatus Doudnabacteria bacterium CG10_big_fil_rev_8_21_14_0_10_42_18]
MLPEQLNKIKNIVTASRLLDQSEREEWLALLGLMNDKQLFELQKILSSALAPAKQSLPAQKSKWDRPENNSGHVFNPGPLTHIVNLPSVKAQAQELAQRPKIAPQTIVKPSGVAKASFFTKLKTILKEKELPSGHEKNELELSAPGEGVSSVKPQPSNLAAKQEAKLEVWSKAKPPPAEIKKKPPVVPQAPKIPITDAPAKSPGQNIKTENLNLILEKGRSTPVNGRGGEKSKTVLGGKEISEVQSEKAFALDTFGRRSANLEIESTQETRGGIDKWPELESVSFSEKKETSSEPLVLDSLDKLAKITVSLFNSHSLEEFSTMLKKLIKVHGYHEVIFRLEKSPLYDAYIKTGAKLLSEEDRPEGGFLKEEYLNKMQFENFVDLLRQIQTV